MEVTRRYRVNVSTSVKGFKTYDCTVELSVPMMGETSVRKVGTAELQAETLTTDQLKATILSESDGLVAELDKRYPPLRENKLEIKED